ncbi:MAG: alpha/beta fold hydrolase, partial [Acetobacteraceae bacterium]
DLARHLPADSCVYGLEAVGLDGDTDPLPTVEAMAAHYVAAVPRTQPEGPYVLGGYSAGGAIAYEMARQMAEAGLPVQRLILLDANAPGNASVAGMQAGFGPGYVYLVVGNWFGLRWGMTRPLVMADLLGLDKPAMLDRVVAHLLAHAAPPIPEDALRRHLTALDRVGWAVGSALLAYAPPPLTRPVDVLLVECTQGMVGADNVLGLPDMAAAHAYREGWERLFAAPIARVAIDCDHFALLRGSNGARVAALLTEKPPIAAPATDRVHDVVVALIREMLPDVPADLVTPDRSMTELGATSIDRVEVATLAMETLGITVPHQDLAGVGSIGALIAVLQQHMPHG